MTLQGALEAHLVAEAGLLDGCHGVAATHDGDGPLYRNFKCNCQKCS